MSALIQCFNFDKISGKAINKLSKMIFSGIVVSVPYIFIIYIGGSSNYLNDTFIGWGKEEGGFLYFSYGVVCWLHFV